ncbi:unnamed protein product [Prunus armeniaca]
MAKVLMLIKLQDSSAYSIGWENLGWFNVYVRQKMNSRVPAHLTSQCLKTKEAQLLFPQIVLAIGYIN